MFKKKATDEQLIKSYEITRNVWKTAEEFGMCGQSVHERLTKLGVINKMNVFTEKDYKVLKKFYETHDLKRGSNELEKLAKKMGRTKQFLSRKANELGLAFQGRKWDNKIVKKMKKRAKNMLKKYGNNMWKQGKRKIADKEIFFRSRWEYNYALYLQHKKQNKEIKEWEYEAERFIFEKIKRGTTSYLPDFKVTRNDNSIYYVEIKGWNYASGATKLKRMAKYYPNIELILIDKKKYKEFENEWKFKLDKWE